MIKLTLNPEAEATESEFSTLPILIGSAGEAGVHLTLPMEAPEGIRLEITGSDGTFFITNTGSRTVATLNGMEVSKSAEIESGDRLHFNDIVVLFATTAEESGEESSGLEDPAITEEELDTLLEDVNALDSVEPTEEVSEDEERDLSLEQELEEILSDSGFDFSETVETQELTDEDLDALIAEAEGLTPEPLATPEQPEETVSLEESDDEPLEFALDDSLFDEESPPKSSAEEAEPEKETAEAPAEPADEPQEDLILDFQESPVDEELDQVIAEREKGDSVSSVRTLVLDEEPQASEEDWGHIERDLISNEDLDEETRNEDFVDFDPFEEEARPLKKIILVATFVLFAMGGALSFIGLTYLKNQNFADELIAQRGLADVAMALTHAQTESRTSYHYQLSDPDFIEKHLNATLSPAYRSLSTATARNGFIGGSYEMEVYSQETPARFLLIARPVNDWRQQFAPRSGFVIDSSEMIVREDKKSEQWREILGDRGQLALVDEEQFAAAITTTTPLRLARLNANSISSGFRVPRDLPYIIENADKIIYNAPRYHAFTDQIVRATARYNDASTSERDKAVLRHNLSRLSALPHLVLYSTGSMEEAESAHHALEETLPPGLNFLVGHVTLGEESATVVRSELILDEAAFALLEATKEGPVIEKKQQTPMEALDTSHPLFITLMELSKQRQDSLNAVGEKIIRHLNNHIKKETPEFFDTHNALMEQYQVVTEEYKDKISRILHNLYEDYVEKDPEKNRRLYLASVKATELEHLLPADLQAKARDAGASAPQLFYPPKTFEEALEKVEASGNLKELHDNLEKLNEVLVEGDEDLMQRQNSVKTLVLRRVGDLLLSPESALTRQNFQERNRLLLARILNLAHVSEVEERNFYLGEFDHLMAKFRSTSQETGVELRSLQKQIEEASAAKLTADGEYQSEMRKLRKETEERLDEKRQEMNALKNQLSHVPLRTATTSPEEQQTNYGRLGQQILIHESLRPASPERDKKLYEAIGLLSQSTRDNRALWADLLEARRLLTENPKEEIMAILESDLGFSPTRHPVPAKIRKDFKKYISAKKQLTRTKSREQYEAQATLFRQNQGEVLEEIVSSTRQIQRECSDLMRHFDLYISRVDEFTRDYTRARDEGFFAADQRYHSNMLYQLQKKLKSVEALRSRVESVTSELVAASREHESLALSELGTLSSDEVVDSAAVSSLQQRHNKVHYPNVIAGNLNRKVKKTLNLQVHPIPQ